MQWNNNYPSQNKIVDKQSEYGCFLLYSISKTLIFFGAIIFTIGGCTGSEKLNNLAETDSAAKELSAPNNAQLSSTIKSSLERKARTKDVDALAKIYNIAFDKRSEPDIHASLAAENTLLIKVQQHELINAAADEKDFVSEDFEVDLSSDDIEIIQSDGTVLRPNSVQRKSKIASSLKQAKRFILDHFFYIEMSQKLDVDETYEIRFKRGHLNNFTFRPKDSVALSIHHARVYDQNNPIKQAKLSSWNGKTGLQYSPGTAFHIRREDNGQIVHSGKVQLASASDTFAGTDVFTLDFSHLNEIGTYHLEVEGIGRSLPFEIRSGVWEQLTTLMLEGLLSHRAFYDLTDRNITFPRPGNPNIVFYKSSLSEADFKFLNVGKVFSLLPETANRDIPYKLSGGWFDAGDYDTKVEHLSVVTSLVNLYNSNPDFFSNFSANLPESSDRIPDILNEAIWGLQLYEQLQTPEGGVSGGFEFDSHPNQTQSWEEKEAFIYAPDFFASYNFAIAAAKLSSALEPHDSDKSTELSERAIRAMDWAEQKFSDFKFPSKPNKFNLAQQARQHAAVELYRLTRQKKYHDIFISIPQKRNYDASFTYAQLTPKNHPDIDLEWQTTLKQKLIEYGDDLVAFGSNNGFNTINNPKFNQNWGFNTVITTQNAHYLAMAHQLSNDQKYLNTLAASMQFGLGMNPDNLAFTTGTVSRKLAYDEPDNVLHADGMYLDAIPAGITLYGFFANPWFAWPTVNQATGNTFFDTEAKQLSVPLLEVFNDYHNLVPIAEYTIHQTIEDQIFAFGYLTGQGKLSPRQRQRPAKEGQR